MTTSMEMAFANSKSKEIKEVFIKVKKQKINQDRQIASIKKRIRNEIKRYEVLEQHAKKMFVEYKNDEQGYNKILPVLRAFCKKADDDSFTYVSWDMEEVSQYWKPYTLKSLYNKLTAV